MRDFATRLDRLAELTLKLESAGALRRAEARLIRIRQAEVAANLVTADAEVVRLAGRIRHDLGLPPASEVRLVPGNPPAPIDPAADLATALLRHPGQIAALAEHDAAEAALELEIRRQYPDLDFAPGLGREDGDDQLTLGLSLPLPLFSGNRRAIAEATARRDVARARLEAGLEERIVAVADAQARHAAALNRQAVVNERVVPLTTEQFEEARRLAELGEVDTLLLLASLASRHDADQAALDATLTVATAAIELHELLGAPEPAAAASGTNP
jgi:outer membrane protein TolC